MNDTMTAIDDAIRAHVQHLADEQGVEPPIVTDWCVQVASVSNRPGTGYTLIHSEHTPPHARLGLVVDHLLDAITERITGGDIAD